jgi:hypothetical protein
MSEYHAGYAEGKEYAASAPDPSLLLRIARMEISDLDMLADLGVELDGYSEGIAGFRQGIIDFCCAAGAAGLN